MRESQVFLKFFMKNDMIFHFFPYICQCDN